MARALVTRAAARETVLQQVDREERAGQVAVAERLVLVVLDARLAVEVNVEELARVERLCQRMRVVQAGHLLVTRLRVQAHDVAVLQLRDKGQRVADRRQENVAARLIRLRLQANLEVVAARLNVGGDRVQALLVAVERRVQVL